MSELFVQMNIDFLRQRAKIVSGIRGFFDARDFVEIETAVAIPAPAPEEHIDCPRLLKPLDATSAAPFYLRASPELQMKKLLAAGFDRLYQIGPCFREGERGSRHNPEFTMLEWYRRGATYHEIAEDLKALVVSCGGSGEGIREIRVREAYRRFADWDPWTAWDQDRFDFDMATKVEPAIKALGGGVFLTDYPPVAASLAKLTTCGDETFAERWEFYWDGLELANCFTELVDAEEQSRRFAKARENRRVLGEADYPLDEEFLQSLPLIGSAAGVALGVDRLVMMLTGAPSISAVRAPL